MSVWGLEIGQSKSFSSELRLLLCFFLFSTLGQFHEPYLHLDLVDVLLVDIVLDKFSHEYCKGEGLYQFCRNFVNNRVLWYSLIYHHFHRRIRDRFPNTFNQRTAAHGLGYGNKLPGQFGYRGYAIFEGEAYDCVRYHTVNIGDQLAHCLLQLGR